MRELVENDPLFSIFMLVDVDADDRPDGRKFVIARKEDGARIRMPDPGME
jgi:hypothetical protein